MGDGDWEVAAGVGWAEGLGEPAVVGAGEVPEGAEVAGREGMRGWQGLPDGVSGLVEMCETQPGAAVVGGRRQLRQEALTGIDTTTPGQVARASNWRAYAR